MLSKYLSFKVLKDVLSAQGDKLFFFMNNIALLIISIFKYFFMHNFQGI